MFVYNPFLKKMKLATSNEKAASYQGVFLKCLWYWLLCFLGVVSYYYLPLESLSLSILCIGIVCAILCPLIIFFIPVSASFFGSIYSIIQGYLIALATQLWMVGYKPYVFLAIGITILMVIVLFILYVKRIVRVNQKFRAVFLSLFIISIIVSLLVYLSSFYTDIFINLFYKDGLFSVFVVFGMLFLAMINLVFEFDYVVQIVSKKACKKYEWVAGYGLFMSILFIFMRVLEIFEKLGRDK